MLNSGSINSSFNEIVINQHFSKSCLLQLLLAAVVVHNSRSTLPVWSLNLHVLLSQPLFSRLSFGSFFCQMKHLTKHNWQGCSEWCDDHMFALISPACFSLKAMDFHMIPRQETSIFKTAWMHFIINMLIYKLFWLPNMVFNIVDRICLSTSAHTSIIAMSFVLMK